MRIEQSNEDPKKFYVGYDGALDSKTLKRTLDRNYASCHDGLYTITTWREADAADTNTESDLEDYAELHSRYDRVDVIWISFE